MTNPAQQTLSLPLGRAVRHHIEGTHAVQRLFLDGVSIAEAAEGDWETEAFLAALQDAKEARGGGLRLTLDLGTHAGRVAATGLLKVLGEYVEAIAYPAFPGDFTAAERRAGRAVFEAIVAARAALRAA